jgi:hypothetical protein
METNMKTTLISLALLLTLGGAAYAASCCDLAPPCCDEPMPCCDE